MTTEASPEIVSVVIPMYNEVQAIGEDLQAILGSMDRSGLPYEVIVVDDGSTDGSDRMVRQFSHVRYLRHPRNLGNGAALKTGLRAARGEIIVVTDGDGSYPVQEIPRLVAALGDAAMVVGARSRETGSWRWLRRLAKGMIRRLASYLTGYPIPDLNSGFRCFRRELALPLFRLLPAGFSWVSTLTIAFLAEGYPVSYLPIDYYPRKGRSNFHPIRDTYNYLLFVVRTSLLFDPLKVFLPLGFLLLGVGGLKLVRDVIVFQGHIPGSTILILLGALQIAVLGLLADLIIRSGWRRE